MKNNRVLKIVILSVILSIFCSFWNISLAKTGKDSVGTRISTQNIKTAKSKIHKTKTKTARKTKAKTKAKVPTKNIPKNAPAPPQNSQESKNPYSESWPIYSMMLIILALLGYVIHQTFGLHRIINYLRNIASG